MRMTTPSVLHSINPATEEVLATFPTCTAEQLEAALQGASDAQRRWRKTPLAERGRLTANAAAYLRQERSHLAGLITAEMGKPIGEAEAEVEKCAWACDYYAENAAAFLADERRPSNASESYAQFTPLGPVLAIMPWNFPFWQVFRFAAPAVMAGNTVLLKHAPNVPQCALAIDEVFRASGFPAGVLQVLLLAGTEASELVADPRIAAVTLTGSDRAGAAVGAAAGRAVKKAVLELGGSDPFIVLGDADLDAAVETGVRARFQNAGQSCIAAKRFLVVESVFEAFRERFVGAVRALRVGDPTDRSTHIGPMARADLRDALEAQLRRSLDMGAKLLSGGERRPGRGYFFLPTVVTEVRPDAPLVCEEVFGPVAVLIRVRDADEAIRVANDSQFGLGCSLWTRDLARAKAMARDIETGMVFINGMVASDPRLPFGGIKRSGYGRELSELGLREFVNVQTVWIGPKVE